MDHGRLRTALLALVAASLVLTMWLQWIGTDSDGEIRLDGISRSGFIVMAVSIASSLACWFLLSRLSGRYSVRGIILCIITGASLALPFLSVLGPNAGIVVGVVAGFAAFRLQRRMDVPAQGRSLKVAVPVLAAAYLVLVATTLAVTNPPLWEDAGSGPWFFWLPGEDPGSAVLVMDYDALAPLLISAASLSATVLLVRTRD